MSLAALEKKMVPVLNLFGNGTVIAVCEKSADWDSVL